MNAGNSILEEFKSYIADRLYLKVVHPWDTDRTEHCRITELLEEKPDGDWIELKIDKRGLDEQYSETQGEKLAYMDWCFVTCAEDVAGNRKFFLKIYWLNKEQLDMGTRESGHIDLGYRREKNLPAISSPYIASVLGTLSCEKEIRLTNSHLPREIHYVLYEWAEKASLYEWCENKNFAEGMTPWEKSDSVYIRQCLQILRECLYGLKDIQRISAIDRYFVHRDVSPWNIMVYEEEDGRVWVKYIDFGLAVMKEKESDHEPDRCIGTPGFSWSDISDLSSLARVFCYMVSNKKPVLYEGQGEWRFLNWEETNYSDHLKKAGNILADLPELEVILKRMWNAGISVKAEEMIQLYESWLKKQRTDMQAELPDMIGIDSSGEEDFQGVRVVIRCNTNERSKTYHLTAGKGYLLTPNDASLCGEKTPLAYIYMVKTDTDCMACTVLMNGCRIQRPGKILERFRVGREQERRLQVDDVFVWNKDGQEICWQVMYMEKYGGRC